jgi:trigger factor
MPPRVARGRDRGTKGRQVKLTVERLPESRAVLEIAADEAEFAKAMDKAYRRVAQQVQMPGFRKGKAPRGMIERAYGRGVFLEEAHRQLMDDLYRDAIKEAGVSPVGEPEVEIVEAEPLAFKVTIPIYPEIEPGDYAAVRAEPIDATPDEAAVDEMLENLRKGASPWVDPQEEGMELGPDSILRPKQRTPRPGDQVTIDYTVYESDPANAEQEEDAQFVLGESGLLERLEEEITRLRPGETSSFAAEFAEDDAVVDAGLRGKTMHYTVTLKGIKERDLLPVDDDLAKTVGDVDTLAELRDEIRENLHRDKTTSARTEVLNAIIKQVTGGATVDIPAPMIDDAVEDDLNAMRQRLAQRGLSVEAYLRLTGQDLDALRAELRPEASRRLRQSLVLREIAKREEIAVADEDLDASVERMVASAAAARDPRQAEQFFRSDFVRANLRNELFDRKLQDRLIEFATEGRGAVLNPWEAPVVEPTAELDQAAIADESESDSLSLSGDESASALGASDASLNPDSGEDAPLPLGMAATADANEDSPTADQPAIDSDPAGEQLPAAEAVARPVQ